MFLPISHDKMTVRRMPVVTIVVILLTVASHVFVTLASREKEAEAMRALVTARSMYVEHPELGTCKPLEPFEGLALPPSVGVDLATSREYQRACSELDLAISQIPAQQLGYVPARSKWFTLFTYVFLHADVLHLVGNMWFLFLCGMALEDRWGRLAFPVYYLVAGALAAGAQHLASPLSERPIIGASGAVAGAMGAFLVLYATSRIRFVGAIDIPVIAIQRFGIGDSVGLATYGGSLLFPTPTSQNPIELQPGTVFAHGQNGQLLFGYSTGTIHSFTLAAGVTPFITLPAGRLVVGVQTSPERIVWIDGVRAGEGWADLRWHWSPLVASPASVVVHDGPTFPADARAAPFDLHTTGNWAITEVGIGPEDVPLPRFVIAWNITTGAMHVLPERPGKVLKRAFLLTPAEMILGYRDLTSFEDGLDELVGLELNAIPDIIARWSAGKN